MRKKYKISLLFTIGSPIVLGIPILANLYFQTQLIQLTYLSAWFVVAAIVPLLSTLGNHRVGGKEAVIKRPFILWLLRVITVILFFYTIFLTESIVFLHQGSEHYGVNVRRGVTELFHKTWLHSILFPWGALAAVFVTLSVRSEQHGFHPFSQWVRRTIFSFRIGAPLRKGVDIFVENSARFLTTQLMAFITLQLLILFGGRTFSAVPTAVTFVGMMLFPYAKIFKRMNERIKTYGLPPIVTFAFLVASMLVIFFLARLLFFFGVPYLDPLTQRIFALKMPAVINKFWQPTWTLWFWSWWIIAIPLLASIIVRLSHGRSIREVVLVILIIPTLLTLLYHFYQPGAEHCLQGLVGWLLRPNVTTTLRWGTQLLFLLFLLKRSANHFLWLGFIPINAPKKVRVFPLRGFWFMLLAFVSALTLRSIYGATMLQVLIALPLFLILLISLVYRLPESVKKKANVERSH